MYSRKTDGRLQVTSAIGLLEFSRLVKWNRDSAQFTAEAQATFELSWRDNVSPVFGRLICWINFSAGAEFLAKGVCLLHDIEVRRSNHPVPANPKTELTAWVTQYFNNPEAIMEKTTNFGDLGALVSLKDKNNKGKLKQLCEKMGANQQDETLLLVAYDFLRRTIRNRDSHAYRPNERDANFHLVPDLFVKCFNLLLTWVPDGQRGLNIWRDNAEEFVANLPKPRGAMPLL